MLWRIITSFYDCSIQFSHSVISNSLLPHGLQHTRPPCPSPTSKVYSNSCPLNQWCHPTISSSSCLQSFPASGSFSMSQLFKSGGHKYWSFSFSISPSVDYIVHGILQARILEWVAFSFSRGSSQPRDWTQVSHIAGRVFTSWATREALWLLLIQISIGQGCHLEISNPGSVIEMDGIS